MAWSEPVYKPSRVNAAGKFLSFGLTKTSDQWDLDDWIEYNECLLVINNWRAAHSYPLNTFQINLRRAARRLDANAIIAQRIKRLSSITFKLQRFKSMKLTQMQDIGGCRSVVNSVAAVRQLVHYYEKESAIKHVLASKDDYISKPQPSGYRGIHLVYRYFSDKKATEIYNGLKIEMQIRSQYQHAWATAVETVGTFVHEALKSSIGPDEWLRFFALMGTAIAIREKMPVVPDAPTSRKLLLEELSYLSDKLAVAQRLGAYRTALRSIQLTPGKSSSFYLLELDAPKGELEITGFRMNEIDRASESYIEAEKKAKGSGTDAVLVSVESLAALPRAYPNYFADTRMFLELLSQALSGHRRRIRTQQLTLGLDSPPSD